MDEATCLYCRQRIVRINYALGPRWMHQHKGDSFQDDVHEFCRLSRATPWGSDGRADRPSWVDEHGINHADGDGGRW